ncbi:hypothetical protein [Mesoplasma melaleucae]|uniref:Uncharacterized protein n=1 Tax=Mesoplasma melaleucae TaxID=81459 RepID=A0A2K8NWL9_9MOLU|nr:hypothetical protein [Mesoplasma melaleucae]ATZ18245.1 hypothetical protein EMELA_v1c07580 [Mesoplasma melaleucae]
MKKILAKLNNTEIDKKINNKVFRDFIKFFETKFSLKINHELYLEFENVVNKVATYNKHLFIRQSDLFGMLLIEQNQIENFEEKFYEAIKDTMFKDVIMYQNLNSDIKDDYEIKYNNKTLSLKEKEHANQLVKWIKKQVEIFSNEKLIEDNPQLKNAITGDLAINFFKQQNEIFIRIYKWHSNVFEIMGK